MMKSRIQTRGDSERVTTAALMSGVRRSETESPLKRSVLFFGGFPLLCNAALVLMGAAIVIFMVKQLSGIFLRTGFDSSCFPLPLQPPTSQLHCKSEIKQFGPVLVENGGFLCRGSPT